FGSGPGHCSADRGQFCAAACIYVKRKSAIAIRIVCHMRDSVCGVEIAYVELYYCFLELAVDCSRVRGSIHARPVKGCSRTGAVIDLRDNHLHQLFLIDVNLNFGEDIGAGTLYLGAQGGAVLVLSFGIETQIERRRASRGHRITDAWGVA